MVYLFNCVIIFGVIFSVCILNSIMDSVIDWGCLITTWISVANVIAGIILHSMGFCIFALIWMVIYTFLWISDRESQKPTQLVNAIIIALIEALMLGYVIP